MKTVSAKPLQPTTQKQGVGVVEGWGQLKQESGGEAVYWILSLEVIWKVNNPKESEF